MSRVPRIACVVCLLFMLATFGLGAAAPAVPSLAVMDQKLVGNALIVESVVANEPGWVAIHAEAAVPGNPGDMVGASPVQQGQNNYLFVTVDATKLTPVLYVVLHFDRGQRGKFEFPGPDEPVTVDGKPVTATFHLLSQKTQPSSEPPSLSVLDQSLHNGEVVVGRVVARQAGYVMIHAEAEQPGNPGQMLGYSPVAAGETTYLRVAVPAGATSPVMYAVLHIDAGTQGKLEFPGPDTPVTLDGKAVTASFHLLSSGSEGGVMPASTPITMSMSMGEAGPTATGPVTSTSVGQVTASVGAAPSVVASATPTGTATPAQTVTPANTTAPADTPAPTATPSSAPTATAAPSATPTQAPTATAAPTATSPNTATPAAAAAATTGRSTPEVLPRTGGEVGTVAMGIAIVAALLFVAGIAVRRGDLRKGRQDR